MKVILSWVSPESGGGRVPPRTLKYTGVAKFLGMRSSSKTTAWSVVLEFETMPQVGGEQYGTMEFLFDSAPKELSQAGANFILIEGRIRVAEGQVIESNK